MITPDKAHWAFIVLLPERRDRDSLAELLIRVTLPSARDRVVCLAPPKGGTEFFATDPEISDWVTRHVPDHARRVYLLMHDRDVDTLVTHHDGLFYIGVADASESGPYEDAPNVTAFVAGNPLAFIPRLLKDWGDTPGAAHDEIFGE